MERDTFTGPIPATTGEARMRNMRSILVLLLLSPPCLAWEAALVYDPRSPEPVKFGLAKLKSALARKGVKFVTFSPYKIPSKGALILAGRESERWLRPWLKKAHLKVPHRAESFALGKWRGRGIKAVVVAGSDDAGTMYGLLELAERLEVEKGNWFEIVKPLAKWPFLEVRAVNLFLCLPFGEEGWENWWFLSEDFWRTLLDLMAESRLNVLDLHGMYDILTTGFPNIFPYFVHSEKFPEVGLPPEMKRRNLEMLKKVVRMAKARGVKVALMSYHTSWSIRERRRPPYEATEENIALYNRECTRKLVEAVPDLWLLGFRIGESGRSEDFFKNAHLAGVLDTKRRIGVYTRTWLVRSKEKILELGQLCPADFYIEIKFNGEHLGLPYLVAGGRMAGWGSYSFQNYPCFPRNYRIIWQIRACGTHRIFFWGWPDFVKRTVKSCRLDGAAGFSLEPPDAYYPKFDYFHAPNVKHDFFKWTHQRYWFWHLLWGRLAYDPETPESVWLHRFRKRFGAAGDEVYRMVVEMSKIVPWIYASHCLGPDHRQMAPEMETGGDLERFIVCQPLDTLTMMSVAEEANLCTYAKTARLRPSEVANLLQKFALRALKHAANASKKVPRRAWKEFECLRLDAEALAHLARYYAAKFTAALRLARFRAKRHYGDFAFAYSEALQAVEEWKRLAEVTSHHYRPLPENLRMRSLGYPYPPGFHWRMETKELERDLQILDKEREKFQQSLPSPDEPPLLAPGFASFLRPHGASRIDFFTEATAASKGTIKTVTLRYRINGGKWQEKEMFPSKLSVLLPIPFVYKVHLVLPPNLRQLDFHFEAEGLRARARCPRKGEFSIRFVGKGENYFAGAQLLPHKLTYTLSFDASPPQICLLNVRRRRLPGGRERETFVIEAKDETGVREAWLWWKPLPSERRWRKVRMRRLGGDKFGASVEITSDGAFYCFEAIDSAGNGAMFPNFLKERPYFVIEPWFAPSAEGPHRP